MWALLAGLALADEPLPLPTPAPGPYQRRLSARALPHENPGGKFWVPHRLSQAFLVVEGVAAATALVGGALVLFTPTQDSFQVGLGLLGVSAYVGFSAAPGVLITETIAYSALKPRSAVGLVLGYSGVGLLLLAPLVDTFVGGDVTVPTLVLGTTLACVGGPIQVAVDHGSATKLALLPAGNGLMLAGAF